MGDSVPLKLALPELKYPIGSQPKEKSAINQYSGSDYISIVKSILKPDEMIRVRGSFLGPVMKLSERGLKLSAKIVYAILTRSIVSVKENEGWFHFVTWWTSSETQEKMLRGENMPHDAHPGREHIIAEEQRREFSFGISKKMHRI
ncbi:unnamed protein product [Brassica napus]|uniref:(rape) hypothetical protein n=1 Tax=Brassica napus TaxID=3708 RepID=A0A817B7I7_BRANA|nr:unnamed protein product [Brassica napus]